MENEIKKVRVKDLVLNPINPRTIKDEKFKQLKKSISEFPEMLAARPIVVNSKMEVLGGNMRLRAMLDLGIEYANVVVTNFTDEQQAEFIIKDNLSFGEWDWDALANEWDTEKLQDWGLDIPSYAQYDEEEKEASKKDATDSLRAKFIVPPFSILDTRQGYWQDRKRAWREIIGDNGESRENKLFTSPPTNPVSKKLQESGGVSLLDPVLSETICHWFAVPNGTAFDCFAGDSVFGYVAAYTGQKFTGIELRQEQADLNAARVAGMSAQYICDDGQNVCNHIEPESQDLFFSCPPYFDLEVYSDLENDASNQGSYPDFLQILKNAFTGAIKCLKPNRFAVVVVGDIRDKNGFYRCFPDDIKAIFKEQGVLFYSDLILIEVIGTGALRASKQMGNRKPVKCHQNVLVFYKGDPTKIKSIYPKIEIPETDGSQDVEL